MKPFNLEEAKAGTPVVTRDGLPVRIICWDAKICESTPILALARSGKGHDIMIYTDLKGSACYPCHDLYMKTEKKTGWVNVYYQHSKTSPQRECGDIFPTEEKAKAHASGNNWYIATIKIEWEE